MIGTNQSEIATSSYNQLISAMASFAPAAGISGVNSNSQLAHTAATLTMPH